MSGRTDQPNRHRSQRRIRLTELLHRRDEVARRWAESFSHGLEGVPQLTLELMFLETALTQGWPSLTDEWVYEWAQADIGKLHDPDTGPAPGCTICAQESQRAG